MITLNDVFCHCWQFSSALRAWAVIVLPHKFYLWWINVCESRTMSLHTSCAFFCFQAICKLDLEVLFYLITVIILPVDQSLFCYQPLCVDTLPISGALLLAWLWESVFRLALLPNKLIINKDCLFEVIANGLFFVFFCYFFPCLKGDESQSYWGISCLTESFCLVMELFPCRKS